MSEVVGYVLSGVEGGRAPTNIAYYHRADRLRELAEAEGIGSVVQYAKRNASEVSAIRRMLGSAWMAEKFKEARAVYAAGAEAGGIAAWALRKSRVPVLYDVHTPAVGEKWMAFKLSPSPREFAVYIEACIAELTCIPRRGPRTVRSRAGTAPRVAVTRVRGDHAGVSGGRQAHRGV